MKALLLTLSILSSSLTPLKVFAESSDKPDRRQLAWVAFQQLPQVVAFAASSREFRTQAKLTEKEIEQLNLVYQETEKIHTVREWGQSLPQKIPVPALEFSDNPQDFKLNPGEVMRLAVTSSLPDDPIMFYLPYLNSPSYDPTLLDIVQLLIHEMGRKLGKEREDEDAINNVAAKLKLFLVPYYQVAEFNGKSRIEVLSLPTVVRYVQFSPYPEPLLLLNEDGHVVFHHLNLSQSVRNFNRFIGRSEGSGNIMEQALFRVTDLHVTPPAEKHLRIRFGFNVELQSQLVLLDPNMSMRPGVQMSPTSGMMIPNPRLIGLLAPTAGNVEVRSALGRARDSKTPQHLVLQMEGWTYSDISLDARVVSASVVGREVNVELAPRIEIKTLQLMVESENGSLLISGTQDANGKYRFILPELLPAIKIRQLVVNRQARTQLRDIIKIPATHEAASSDVENVRIEILTGEGWHQYDGQGKIKAAPGPVRLRLVTNRSPALLRQIRLRWNEGAAIYWDKPDQVTGTYSQVIEEVIDNSPLTQQTESHNIYEFVSEQSVRFHKPKSLHEEIIGSKDSHRRFLKEVLHTTSALKTEQMVYSPMLKIYNEEFIETNPDCESLAK